MFSADGPNWLVDPNTHQSLENTPWETTKNLSRDESTCVVSALFRRSSIDAESPNTPHRLTKVLSKDREEDESGKRDSRHHHDDLGTILVGSPSVNQETDDTTGRGTVTETGLPWGRDRETDIVTSSGYTEPTEKGGWSNQVVSYYGWGTGLR